MTRATLYFVALVVALVMSMSIAPSTSHAAVLSLTATLNEAQAATPGGCPSNPPPTGTSGSATMSYDTTTKLLTWSISFVNLSAAPNAAHFHGPAMPGADAGIQVPITDLTSPSTGSATLTASQEADLLNGLYYINYHTAACPGGELRGQVIGGGVGGITELPVVSGQAARTAGSSGRDGALLRIAIAAGAAVFAAGAWYVKKQWR